MSLDFSRCRLPPFAHQREDTAALIDQKFFFIASEMRTGKTKIVIDAAQFLFAAGAIDKVVVVAPAPVRDVWADRRLGELAKHLWLDTPSIVTEYHARLRMWLHATEGKDGPRLEWYITNYEFLRSKNRLAQLMPACGPRTLLVGDESSFLKNHAAEQTKAFLQLRRACGRVVLLNGTPIFHSPLDLFSQGNILHPSILDCKYITHFKARYAVQTAVLTHGGKPLVKEVVGRDGRTFRVAVQQISGWTNLEDLQRRFAPCTVRRLQRDCVDMPEKLDPVALTATMTPETWRAYRDMRDELVIWFQSEQVAAAATAATRVMRLSQITSGFVGGVEDAVVDAPEDGLLEEIMIPGVTHDIDGERWDQAAGAPDKHVKKITDVEMHGEHGIPPLPQWPRISVREIGREKLDVLLWFIEQRLEEDPDLHLVAWCRFRAELHRMVDAVRARFPMFEVGAVHGGQARADRLRALSLLKPETSPQGPVFVGGIEGTGSFGLDMTAAHTCVTMSSGYSPGRVAQTLDRVYGPGQKHPIAYFDIVAVGPRGQRTIDHAIIEARRGGEDVAQWTSSAWVKALTEE